MRNILVTMALLFSNHVFAHLNLGVYKGIDANQQECSITIKSISFENNMKHPLNELVEIEWKSNVVVLKHLAILNTEANTAFPNSDALSKVEAIKGGAKYWDLKIQHTDSYTGPTEFIEGTHLYRQTEQSSQFKCTNLKFQE